MRSSLVQLLTISVLSAASCACVISPGECKVPRSFKVRVTNDYGPVPGLNLMVTHFREDEYDKLSDQKKRFAKIEDFIDVVATDETDLNGEAQFHLAAVGKFYLETKHPAKLLEACKLIVSDDDDPFIVGLVSLKWPEAVVLQTRSLTGTLSEGLYWKPLQPTRAFHLTLHDLVSYNVVATLTTGRDGAFNFGDLPTGHYFLQIAGDPKQDNAPEGNIPVFINPKSDRNSLAIIISETDCGLMYDLKENKAKYKTEGCIKDGKPSPCD
jgi:hypothetical protein